MKRFRWLLVISLLAIVPACNDARHVTNTRDTIPPGAMAYTGYDENGVAVVEGWVKPDIAIIAVDPAFPFNLTGTWKLRRVGGSGEIGPQVGEGTLGGVLQDGRLFVSFNPTRADDNVVSDGAFEVVGGPASEMRWEGSWTWSTLAGPRRSGTFRARG